MAYALINGTIFTGTKVLNEHAVIIENHLIKGIYHINDLPHHIKTIDLKQNNLCAGFIDIQLNGCGGVQFNETLDALSIDTLETMQRTNLKFGCTSYLPTLITSSDEFIVKAISTMREYLKNHSNQALGLHLEGPYINFEKKGIHNTNFIRKSDDQMINFLCDNADVIKIITLAPEQVSSAHISQLANAGICVAIGHSNATYEEAKKGFDSGIKMGTHLYNAMSMTEGRKPGVVGAIFDSKEVYCGIIADGLHVHYANIKLAHQIKQDKLILTTDASLPAGTNIKECVFGAKTVFHENGKCFDSNGTLAGSALTMIEAVKNSVKHTGIALNEAINMATLYPARSLGLDNELGSICAGKVANLVIFDEKFDIKRTILNGQ